MDLKLTGKVALVTGGAQRTDRDFARRTGIAVHFRQAPGAEATRCRAARSP